MEKVLEGDLRSPFIMSKDGMKMHKYMNTMSKWVAGGFK